MDTLIFIFLGFLLPVFGPIVIFMVVLFSIMATISRYQKRALRKKTQKELTEELELAFSEERPELDKERGVRAVKKALSDLNDRMIYVMFSRSDQGGGRVMAYSLEQLLSVPDNRCWSWFFSIDLEKGIWSWKDQTFQIGQCLTWVQVEDDWGVWGVYDLSDARDVNALLQDAQTLMQPQLPHIFNHCLPKISSRFHSRAVLGG
ncbi:hypothetical protein IIA95_00890 [Patescibacteria group bacterium]|nr:hypothetical protein [Patescibacteria group bacterium]